MNKYSLICIFLCVLFSTKSYAQNFHEGDSLLSIKQYDEALLAYEKNYFELVEFPDTSISVLGLQEAKNACLLRKVYCLKAIGKFEEAGKTALRFDLANLSDSSQLVLRNELIVNYYLSGFYEDALSQIQQLKFFVKDSLLTQKSKLWEILSLTQLKRYPEAKEVFRSYLLTKNVKMDIDSVFAFEKLNHFKSVKKAATLATFLPGVGMLYVGNTTEGLVSLGLQVATLAFGFHNITEGYYLSGFFTGFGLFQAFYFGGIRRTEFLASQKNQQIMNLNTMRITKALIELEK